MDARGAWRSKQFYDLTIDNREITDLKAQHAGIEQTMASECRQRWETLLTSGPAFMPLPAGSKAKTEE